MCGNGKVGRALIACMMDDFDCEKEISIRLLHCILSRCFMVTFVLHLLRFVDVLSLPGGEEHRFVISEIDGGICVY